MTVYGEHYNQYRVIKSSTLEELFPGIDPKWPGDWDQKKKNLNQKRDPKNAKDYYDEYFMPCKRVKELDKQNIGINCQDESSISEIDKIM